eukprot:TRINITY_DN67795_c4_g2_i2.p1 TRINITY_DN67795_c4_g2~~TRINITY_DN67795_c4_g2_i2.p1  ORF type:complete len:821 (-),score=28.58 TRINITY_DN67795_c4_g2_i2:29-2443(-)
MLCSSCGSPFNGMVCQNCGYSIQPAAPAAYTSPDWHCSKCTLLNAANLTKCSVCDAPRTDGNHNVIAERQYQPPPPHVPQRNAGDWTCKRCTLENAAHATQCGACDAPKPGQAPPPPPAMYHQQQQPLPSHLPPAPPPPSTPQLAPSVAATWTCKRCTLVNTPTDRICKACHAESPMVQRPETPHLLTEESRSLIMDTMLRHDASLDSEELTRVGWRKSSHLDKELREQEQEVLKTVKGIRELCGGKPFVDDQFVPSKKSLYGDPKSPKDDYLWQMPRKQDKWSVIKQEITPGDIKQGRLGDCWFLSALCLLATRPHLIDRLLITKEWNEEGVYACRFFHNGKWEPLIVDSNFPTKHNHLVYASAQHNQLWVPLLEKAYAKLHGSYADIVGGNVHTALSDLTGAPCEVIRLEDDNADWDLIWARMVSSAQANFLMGASCGRTGCSAEKWKQLGLISSHAYAIQDVRAEDGERLVRLRNPWGNAEWKGDWREGCPKWTESLKRKIPRANKAYGEFWISYHDFILRFNSVDICKENQSWNLLTTADRFCNHQTVVPSQYYELRVPASTWMFVSLIQETRRGAKSNNFRYRDLGMVVSTIPHNGSWATQTPIVQMWPQQYRIQHVEVLATKSDQTYLLLPYSLTRNELSPLQYTLAIYSANPVSIRPKNYDVKALAIGLQMSVQQAVKADTLAEGVWLYTVTKERATLIVLVNSHPRRDFWIEVNCTGCRNMEPYRKSFLTSDVVPHQSRQLLNAFVAEDSTHGYQWSCRYKFRWTEGRNDPHAQQPHQPLLPTNGSDICDVWSLRN